MVTEIKLYIEGGGKERSTKIQLREGFRHFFRELYSASRAKQIRIDLILCKSQNDAFKFFSFALIKYPDALNVLLVDSDHRVSTSRLDHFRKHFKHVKKYFNQGWQDLNEEHCHLMVQVMEAWFLADPEKLEKFYGKGFRANALPGSKVVETVEKNAVLDALKHATCHTKKGEYHKINHASELLKLVRPSEVRKASRHCDYLFQTLESQIQAIG